MIFMCLFIFIAKLILTIIKIIPLKRVFVAPCIRLQTLYELHDMALAFFIRRILKFYVIPFNYKQIRI